MRKLFIILLFGVSVGLANGAPAETVIKVTLLGTGVPVLNAAALKASGRALSGLLVEAGPERMLFDCGQGVYTRLVESGGSKERPNIGVDKVFISHLHSDHIADLGALYSLGALYRYPISGAPAANVPLRIWGPATFKPSTNPTPPLPDPPLDYPPVGIKPMLENFHKAYETDFYVRQLFTDPKDFSITDAAVETVGSTTDLPDAPSTVVYSNNGVTVTAFLVNHDPVTPAYGFRVDYQGHSFVYSGDTTYNDNLVNNSKNVDLLVHEVYGYQRDDAPEIYDYHTSPEDAARVFLQTNPKLAVFTHLAIPQGTTPRDLVRRTRKAGYHGKLKPGRDLMVIKINSNSKVIAKYLPESEGIDEKPATSDFVEVEQYRRRKTP